jgi:hypothetical protein
MHASEMGGTLEIIRDDKRGACGMCAGVGMYDGLNEDIFW